MVEISSMDFAALARDVYSPGKTASSVAEWNKEEFYGDPSNGFFAAAYHIARPRSLVVAFRGTGTFSVSSLSQNVDAFRDWGQNIDNVSGFSMINPTSQANTARDYFEKVSQNFRKQECAVCGHSLGGFLAAMVSVHSGVPAVTFNPAPLGGAGLPYAVRKFIGSLDADIVNFRLKGDVVSALRQYNLGKMIELDPIDPSDRLKHSIDHLAKVIARHGMKDKSPRAWAAATGAPDGGGGGAW